MSAIAFELPEEVCAARGGLIAFADQEVVGRHAEHQALFDNPHALRIVNVADGSNEILNRAIGQRLLKGDTDL